MNNGRNRKALWNDAALRHDVANLTLGAAGFAAWRVAVAAALSRLTGNDASRGKTFTGLPIAIALLRRLDDEVSASRGAIAAMAFRVASRSRAAFPRTAARRIADFHP